VQDRLAQTVLLG